MGTVILIVGVKRPKVELYHGLLPEIEPWTIHNLYKLNGVKLISLRNYSDSMS